MTFRLICRLSEVILGTEFTKLCNPCGEINRVRNTFIRIINYILDNLQGINQLINFHLWRWILMNLFFFSLRSRLVQVNMYSRSATNTRLRWACTYMYSTGTSYKTYACNVRLADSFVINRLSNDFVSLLLGKAWRMLFFSHRDMTILAKGCTQLRQRNIRTELGS